MDKRTNESPPVFYRTSSPSGPLPKKPNISLQADLCQNLLACSLEHVLTAFLNILKILLKSNKAVILCTLVIFFPFQKRT